MNYKMTARKA